MSFRFAGAHLGQPPMFGPDADVSATSPGRSASSGPRSYGEEPRSTPSSGYREPKKTSANDVKKAQAELAKAEAARAQAAYGLLIQRVIAEQGLRDYVSDAKKAFESTDKTYAPKQYEERKKKYIEEYGKQLLRLANSIGRVTVEEKTYPGSFFDEQVAVRTLPAEYASLFRNPMVRAAAYDDFMSAIAKAQGAMGVSSQTITDTKKFADAKYREAVESGKAKWGAQNLSTVSGAPASWEPVIVAAVKGEAFPRIEYLTSADQVREISPWLADAFRRRSSAAALKRIVGAYVADALGVPAGEVQRLRTAVLTPSGAGEIFTGGRTAAGRGGAFVSEGVDYASKVEAENAKKARDEARRKAFEAAQLNIEASDKVFIWKQEKEKADAEGNTSESARLEQEKAALEQQLRDAEAKAAEAERKALEAERKALESAAGAGGGVPGPAAGGGEVAPFTPPSGGGGGGVAPAPGESAPTVVADDQGGTAIVVPDASVVPVVPEAPAPKAVSPVVLLLAAAAIGGGIWWFNRRKGA